VLYSISISRLIPLCALCLLSQGCYTEIPRDSEGDPQLRARVDFSDPLLNRRHILLFGPIDQPAAEATIQKLLYLDSESHEPIELYLQTPGGEFKQAMAIEETLRLLHSPVNTYAMSECNSGGALLLAAGTGKRRAFRGAVILLHGLKITGKPPAGLTPKLHEAYTNFWRQHTKLPDSWLPFPPDILHVLSAEQALQYGIVDEIIERHVP
jgi:ATP-dependent Clp protease protease subunit